MSEQPMIFKWSHALLASGPGAQHFGVLMAYALKGNNQGESIYPRQDTIAGNLKCSRGTVHNALTDARKLGWLEMVADAKPREGKSAEYRLTIPEKIKPWSEAKATRLPDSHMPTSQTHAISRDQEIDMSARGTRKQFDVPATRSPDVSATQSPPTHVPAHEKEPSADVSAHEVVLDLLSVRAPTGGTDPLGSGPAPQPPAAPGPDPSPTRGQGNQASGGQVLVESAETAAHRQRELEARRLADMVELFNTASPNLPVTE